MALVDAWDEQPVEAPPRKRRRGRYGVGTLIYLLIVIAGAVIGWQFIPKDVIDAVRQTYFDPDAAATINASP
jgi:hypothetical protein